VLARSAGPPVDGVDDRVGEVRGRSDAATTPLTPGSIRSTAALSGPAATTDGVPRGCRLDDDHPVPLALRRQQQAGRARDGVGDLVRGDEARRLDDVGDPVLAIASSTSGRSGPVAEDDRPQPGHAVPRERDRGRDRRTRFSGMWRPAKTTSGSRSSTTSTASSGPS
jgi:hypothetical protein